MEKQRKNMLKEIASLFTSKFNEYGKNDKQELVDINSPVDILNISKRAINALKINNIFTVKQLLESDLDLLSTKKNIGGVTLKELREVVSLYNRKDLQKKVVVTYDNSSLENKTVLTTDNKNLATEITEEYLYKIEDVFSDEWVIKYSAKLGLKNIGLLAGAFPDEFLKDDEIIMQNIYFDEKESLIKSKLEELGINNYPLKYTEEQLVMLNRKPLKDCLKEDYAGMISKEIINILQHPEMYPQKKRQGMLTEKNIDILLRRNGLLDGVEYTLEEIKDIRGDVTSREAVRQQEEKGYIRVARMMSDMLETVNTEIERVFDCVGDIIYCGVLFDEKYKSVTENVLAKSDKVKFYIDFEHSLIMKNPVSCYDELIENLKTYINNNDKNFVKKEDLSEMINNVLINYLKQDSQLAQKHYSLLYNSVLDDILSKFFIHIENGLYKYKHTPKGNSIKDKEEQIAYYFKKLYKKAVNVPQRNEELMRKNLAELYKNLPWLNDYEGSSSVERIIKDAKDIIFCGMGKYIHIDNIGADMEIVDVIISDIRNMFRHGAESVSPTDIYNKYKSELKQANISNKYVLVGLIAYKNPDGIVCDIRRMTLFPTVY